jgi:hypothetical protein
LKSVSTNPFDKGSTQWAFWEAVRRTKPASYKDAVSKVSKWLYETYKEGDPPMTTKAAKAATLKWFEKKKILHTFAKQGLIEVELEE